MGDARGRSVAVVTGSRADYGLLQPVMAALRDADDFRLHTLITGSHLSDRFGQTWREIEADGFACDHRIDLELAADDPASTAAAAGRAVERIGRCLDALRPDLVLVLGDRYEILAACMAATLMDVPIAHLAGGDLTEGAFDDAQRHAITKLAHLHFATNAPAAQRIMQMGEDPARVHVVGSPALDRLATLPWLSRQHLAQQLGITFRQRTLVVTFHPVTRDDTPSTAQLQALLDALDAMGNQTTLIFTGSNADPQGMTLTGLIESFAAGREHAHVFASLGHVRYLSLVREADAVVGNSSSGLYEAPSLGTPTVNIGQRQAGRVRATSVLDTPPTPHAIAQAIDKALHLSCVDTVNPYGDGRATPRILSALRKIEDFRALRHKRFFAAGYR